MRCRTVSHVVNMLDEMKLQTLKAHREQSSLAFFHKTHKGTVDCRIVIHCAMSYESA